MTENRTILSASDLDGFEKRSLPSPGFQVEVVMIDYDATSPVRSKTDANKGSGDAHRSNHTSASSDAAAANSRLSQVSENEDDVFSDSDGEETGASKNKQAGGSYNSGASSAKPGLSSDTREEQMRIITQGTEQISLGSHESLHVNASKESMTTETKIASGLGMNSVNDIKAMAPDASVFTFGDEDDYDSD